MIEQSSASLAEERPSDARSHDENGVDLTLIRAYLDLTPIERLRSLQNVVRTIQRFRPIEPTKQE